MNIVNLLPFEVAIFKNEHMDSFDLYPASKAPVDLIFDECCVGYINDHKVMQDIDKKVINLPEPNKETVYLVSKAVAIFCKDRNDLVVPDGSYVNRNKKVAYTYLKKY